MSKYDQLTDWFVHKIPESFEITIDELEKKTGIVFSPFSRKYPWMNDRTQSLGRSYMKAGYKVSQPYMDKNILCFSYNPEGAIALLEGNRGRKTTNRCVVVRSDVPRPSKAEVEKYLKRWDDLENYVAQENVLNKLFFESCPYNTDMNDILVKVSCLNDFYFTNIFSTYVVAKHILSLNIDERLSTADPHLVDDIATVTMDNGSIKYFYSFATKYCSHHYPEKYAIYDSYVDDVLKYFRNVDCFSEFANEDLRKYERFVEVLREFATFYGLEDYSLKDLDRYLWQLGKDKFPQHRYQGK